ncbi:hypothetical protein PR202_ga06882 [Eleusine coracana subsp. coracana]|uniref:Erythromycin biosynthesis protein CIII-like C-terminal domain-containing protein n=1 Tax=Eleusine coracana subsp. coracana TaxID=191504 RepID=A0AAV5BVZ5_ELECO|nr:hypothetical protein PR202_ga06882 [Eleusine coracana subsp. coracana]
MDGGGDGDGRRARAVFMAFGTKGDVFPIAALAAAFARDQQQYTVVFITHSAHQSLSKHLAASNVRYMPVSSPPVLAAEQLENGSCNLFYIGFNFIQDPVTDLPLLHMREESPLLLYGFSKEVVERPGYWPSGAHICGFWFLPMTWQFSCDKCMELSGSMGFLRNPKAFLMVLKTAIEMMNYRFILFSSGYKPLDSAIKSIASSVAESSDRVASAPGGDSTLLFNDRLLCFSGSIPYSWLFPRCAAAIHHAGSGSTAAALLAGIPQVVCPFLHDQFYWAERLHLLGVAPEPLQRQHLIPEMDAASSIHNAADVLLGAISSALSSKMKAQATRLADRLSLEDGIGEALRIVKEKVLTRNKN